MRPSVLIADDHRLYAEGLSSILRPLYDIVAVARDGRKLVELAVQYQPEFVVTDLSMPIMSGLDAIEELRRRGSRAKFLVLTMHEEVSLAVLAFRVGASAFLLKTSRGDEILQAMEMVQHGGQFLSPDFPQPLEVVLAEAVSQGSSTRSF